MSSPLKAFRKHQKKLIVIFGVLLMVSFTVLGTVQQFFTPKAPGQQEGEEIVATWEHGEITRAELQGQRIAQQSAFIFMNALAQEAQKAGGTPQVQMLQGDSSLRGLARQIILAKKAEELGVVVTEDTITQYLSKLTDGAKRTPEQFEAMFEQLMRDRRGVNYKGFLRYMRQALMAQDMLLMGTAGLSALSPGEAKSYHDRMFRQKSVELLPLEVEDYLSKVKGEPSQAELEELYEKGEDRYTTPPSAEPAFRRRHKIKYGYFKGEAETFRNREEAMITDDQIAKYYAEHKDDFKRASLPDDLGGESSDDFGLPGTRIEPTPDDSLPGQPVPAPGSDADAPEESSPPDETGESSSKDAVEQESQEETNDKSEDEIKGSSKEEEPESSDDQSGIDARLEEATVFVSLVDGDAAEKATAEEKPAEPADQKSAEENGESVDATKKEEKKSAKSGETEDSDAKEVEPADSGGKEDTGQEPEYRPLEEVKDQIRTILAKEAVAKEYEENRSFTKEQPFQFLRDRALDQAAVHVQKYSRKRNRWITYQELGRSDAEQPIEPNWEDLAQKLSLEYGQSPLADVVEIADTEIGKLESQGMRIVNLPQMEQPQFRQVVQSFAEIAFDEEEKLFKPSEFPPDDKPNPNNPIFYNNPGDVRYLYWKAAEKEEHTPPLKEIHDEVTDTWRMQQARKLALADAKKKMADVEGTEESLTEVFGEDSVLQPASFSWLSRGGGNIAVGGGQLAVTDVENVENAGEKFHEAVSRLEEGEVGIATNQDESVVYVVQVKRDSSIVPFQRVGSDINRLAVQNQTSIFQDWLEDIEREYDVEWQDIEE